MTPTASRRTLCAASAASPSRFATTGEDGDGFRRRLEYPRSPARVSLSPVFSVMLNGKSDVSAVYEKVIREDATVWFLDDKISLIILNCEPRWASFNFSKYKVGFSVFEIIPITDPLNTDFPLGVTVCVAPFNRQIAIWYLKLISNLFYTSISCLINLVIISIFETLFLASI